MAEPTFSVSHSENQRSPQINETQRLQHPDRPAYAGPIRANIKARARRQQLSLRDYARDEILGSMVLGEFE